MRQRIKPPSCTVTQLQLADGTLMHDLVDCGNWQCPTSSAKKPEDD
jgi:hypothetical protein